MTAGYRSFGIIILAAGSSSRLGQPKQLLQYKNKSLIKLVTDEAFKVAGKTVIVVSGANKALVESEIGTLEVHLVHNSDWKEGMASSIRCGLKEITNIFPELENVIITVCDQPLITSELFEHLIKKRSESGKDIVASAYKNTLGVPVLFSKQCFNDLLSLNGHQGAKKLLKSFAGDIATVPFPGGEIDIDTEEDYKKLLSAVSYQQ